MKKYMSISLKCSYCIVLVFDEIFILKLGSAEISLTDYNGIMITVGLVMVFNATFNNISVISWWSVLLVEETGVFGENSRPDKATYKLYCILCCIEYPLP